MAGAFLRVPTMVIGEIMDASSFAEIAAVFAFVLLVGFVAIPSGAKAQQAQKPSKRRSPAGAPPQQTQKPSRCTGPAGTQAQQAHKHSRRTGPAGALAQQVHKPSRRTSLTKFLLGVDAASGEELEVVENQSPSDMETPLMKSTHTASQEAYSYTSTQAESTFPYAQTTFSGNDADNDKLEIEADLEMCTETHPQLGEDTGEASEAVPYTIQEENGLCDMCSNPDVHTWGCPVHRVYRSSLLLMHCEMQRTIARGPPGFELLPAKVSSSPLCTLQVA